uniref:Uncharacterized protein n=1 Tax=Lepeophtheirus salmonis TaxID=72036 RepID=A0A0K2TF48_LEPSM
MENWPNNSYPMKL